jgi:uncharacterized integral membrane protein
MGNFWLKVKVGTKIAVFAILTIAVLVFVIQNANKEVKIWLWNDIPTTLIRVLFFTALTSAIFTVLIGTTFRTVRQIREIRARSRSQRLEDEVADMRNKAAMLQTKPLGGSSASLSDVAPPLAGDDDSGPLP